MAGGQDRRDRVGDPLARDVGRGAVDRLVEPSPPVPPRLADGSMPIEPGEDGRLVGEDVAEGVLGHDRVEVGRLVHEGHRAVVDEHVVELRRAG